MCVCVSVCLCACARARGESPTYLACPPAAEGILVCDVEAEGWPIRYANRAAAEVAGMEQEVLTGSSFWQLFGVAPAPGWASAAGSGEGAGGGRGSLRSRAEVQQAVEKGQSCTVTCRLRGGGCDSSGPGSGGGAVASGGGFPSHWPIHGGGQEGCGCGSGELEGVLTGRASLDTLLHGTRSQPSSGTHLRSAASSPLAGSSQRGLAQPELTVAFTPATAPTFLPDQPPIGIPALAAARSGADVACWEGEGAAHAGSGGEEESSRSAAAAGRWWFATLTRRPLQASGSGGSGGAVGAAAASAAAARVEYLRPRQLKDVQLGPLLGVGASGRCVVWPGVPGVGLSLWAMGW